MSEKKLYQDFKKQWRYYIKRLELKNEVGISDCHLTNENEIDIFLELKYMEKKFKEATLPIKKTQFIWHAEYSGRNAYMLFQVGNEYFLFKKSSVAYLKGKVNWNDFVDFSIIKTKEIKNIIKFLEDCF